MLSFDLQALSSRAAPVAGDLPPDDPVWRDEDDRPLEPLRVSGRISMAGPDRYYWHGRIEGGIALPCRRCLADASADLSEETHVIFSQAGDREDDPDVFELDPGAHELDLRPAVRELWLLHAPRFLLCRDDCKGLCPTCGADLNAGACGCPPQADSRWDALRKATGGSQ